MLSSSLRTRRREMAVQLQEFVCAPTPDGASAEVDVDRGAVDLAGHAAAPRLEPGSTGVELTELPAEPDTSDGRASAEPSPEQVTQPPTAAPLEALSLPGARAFPGGHAVPGYFGRGGRRLFGWVHLPSAGTARAAAVLCPSIAREQAGTYYLFRQLADELAAAGIAAVRFDYAGTGDSFRCSEPGADGARGSGGTLDDWTASVRDAVALARETGAARVVLVGMRMGALLAARAATGELDLSGLVLWDPCLSGRSFLREKRAMAVMDHEGALSEGDRVEVPGFVFDAATARALWSLAWTKLEPEAEVSVVVARDRTTQGELRPLLGAISADWVLGPGQADLVESEAGRPVAEAIGTIRSVVSSIAGEETFDVRLPLLLSEAESPASGGEKVVERAVSFGSQRLFGIETEPLDGSAKGAATVFFLSAGDGPHTGPNRLWVDLARRWAGRGVRSVRFDLSGIGDSAARKGQGERVVFSQQAFDDVRETVLQGSALAPSRAVLVGLSSGGYQALESALQLRPAAVMAVNPSLAFHPPELTGGQVDRRRSFWDVAGTEAAAGRSSDRGGSRRSRRAASPSGKASRRRPLPARSLEALADAGVACYLLGDEDHLAALFEGAGRKRRRYTAEPTCNVVDAFDQALLTSPQREQVSALLTLWLRSLIDRTGAR